ncbi:MAG: D-alanyl-D-alanine carboxypeptidase family protein [Variibacter sp.]
MGFTTRTIATERRLPRARGIVAAVWRTASAAAVAAFLTQGAAAQTPKKDDFQISAPYAILIDADSGAVLYEKNADQPTYPSSMAKLMTAEVVFKAIKDGKLKLDDEITISEAAWRRGGAPSGGSSMFAALHSQVKVEDLLRGVIIQSGNDACIALAEAIAGNELAFSTKMTDRARELGLTKSVFTNSNGLPDPNMTVTVRELAMLARHIIRTYPDFYKIYGEREFTWNKIRQQNRNPLLAMSIGADGLKTGYTKEAGYGLVGSAVNNGLRLIMAANGFKTAGERAAESRKLLEWGFRAFEARLLFSEGETVGEAKLYGGAQGRVPLVGTSPIRILVPRGASEKITAKITYTGPVPTPVTKGQPIGHVKVWRGHNLALDAPLQAAEDVPRGTIYQRAFDAATEMVIGLFRAGAERI